MTDAQILQWIKTNLQSSIRAAITGTLYTEDWLAAIAGREVPGLISKYASAGMEPTAIWPLLQGDWSKRKNDDHAIYHGFGPWQIDIGSFPAFVASGDWKDPFKCAVEAVAVLEGKRQYLSAHCVLAGEALDRAITAAYNCGEGNVVKAINAKKDIDVYTANHNYSADVFRLRALYLAL